LQKLMKLLRSKAKCFEGRGLGIKISNTKINFNSLFLNSKKLEILWIAGTNK
jgi:hypothetical protein